MTTTNDVFRKIKELSIAEWKPRPVLNITNIATTLSSDRDRLMPALVELSDMKLIKFEDTAKLTVKLTLLGHTVTRDKS